MDFFSSNRRVGAERAPDDDEDGADSTRPAWLGAPDDVLPAAVPMGPRILHQDPACVIALTGIAAYPAGATFELAVSLRRGDRDRASWDAMHDLVFGRHRPGRFRGRPGDDVGLKFGVLYPDGSTATSLDEIDYDNAFGPDPVAPQAPVLQANGGGGSGGSHRLTNHHSLWLWPLPPPEPFFLIWAWPAAGVDEGRTDLDGKAIRDAAALCVPFWPVGS